MNTNGEIKEQQEKEAKRKSENIIREKHTERNKRAIGKGSKKKKRKHNQSKITNREIREQQEKEAKRKSNNIIREKKTNTEIKEQQEKEAKRKSKNIIRVKTQIEK